VLHNNKTHFPDSLKFHFTATPVPHLCMEWLVHVKQYIIHLQVKGVIRHNTEVDCLGHRQYPAKFPYTGLYGYKTIQTWRWVWLWASKFWHCAAL